MNISANARALVGATRALSIKWSETRENWQDSKAQEFEQKYLVELFASVDRAAPLFDELDKLVTQIRSDCE